MRVEIDGMDGTGKTTIARMLEAELGLKYVHFPTKPFPPGFEKYRPEDAYAFFMDDFEEWFKENGYPDNVVFDRGFVSTLLYQSDWISVEKGLDKKSAMRHILDDLFSRVGKIPLDKVFLFVADVDTSLKRVRSRGDLDRTYETKKKLENVRSNIVPCAEVLSENGYEVEIIDTTEIDIGTLFKVVVSSLKD